MRHGLLVHAFAALALVAAPLPAATAPQGSGQRPREAREDDDAPAADDDPRSRGTRRMAARLAAIAQAPYMAKSSYSNSVRAKAEAEQLAALPPDAPWTAERVGLEFALAFDLLGSGDEEGAIARLEPLAQRVDDVRGLTAAQRRNVVSLLAIAHLRRGEVANCVARHGPDSCLFPIQGGGVHVDREGSLGALPVLERLLERDPRDRQALWLLNVAHMTLGDWPDALPEEHRIPPEAFAPEAELPRFLDVAPRAGLALEGRAGGCVVEDLDGDGDLDVVASSMGLDEQLRYFESTGDGRFADRTAEAGLVGLTGGLNLAAGDADGDGLADVFVPRGGWVGAEAGRQPNSLLLNQGGRRFADVTRRAGVYQERPSQTAAFADFDRDGKLDLFVGNESSFGFSYPQELYRNAGEARFEETAEACGVEEPGFVKAAVWGDYDGDGWPDLYLSCFGEPNRLYRNGGKRERGVRFADVARSAGVAGPLESFTTWFFDYDNDGDLDLFVSGYAGDAGDVADDYLRRLSGEAPPSARGRPCLYRNDGGRFVDAAAELGLDEVLLTMGGGFGDLDGDGWLDFYSGTGDPDFRTLVPNRMYRNDRGRRFLDVTSSGGFGHLQKGHGVAFADVDNDGDQDVYLDLGGVYESDTFRNALFENPGFGSRSLTLELSGTRSERTAVGASVRVHVAGPDGPRVVCTTVSTGGSFGAASLRRTVGLGAATAVERVEVTWPTTREVQVFEGLELDRSYALVEDEERPRELERAPFRLGGAPGER